MVGIGVLKGMWVTLREFIGTYPAGRWLLQRLGCSPGQGLFTVEYPEIKQQHAERHRVFPFLVYDATPDNLRCVACKICEQECPPQCIHITGPAKDEQGRPLKAHGRTYPAQFEIDVSICMSCRICVDVCPFDAIEMDNVHEVATYERFSPLVFTKRELLKSADYFKRIKPTEASVVDARLAAKAKKSALAASPAAGGTPSAAPPISGQAGTVPPRSPAAS